MSARNALGLLAGLAVASTALLLPAQESGGAPTRFWTDASGKYRIRASLEELTEDSVRLKKEDGSIIAVPIERLSRLDQRYLERQRSLPPPAAEEPATPKAGAADWPTFRGRSRDGKSPDTGLLKQWPEGGPKLLWKVSDLGKGFSSVTVADGVIYITGAVGEALVMHAFDLDGKPLWKVQHGPAWLKNYDGARGSVTIDEGRLYLLSGHGLLASYDAKTGKKIWNRDAREFGGKPGGWGYAETPLILDGAVVFKPGGQNCIVALDKKSGRDLWASRGFSAGPEYSSCLAFRHGGVEMIATGTRSGLVCVSANGGQLLWANDFSANNTANCPTPAYADGHLFWANGYGKGGICMRLGPGGSAQEAWRSRDMVCHHGGYVIHEGHIYGNNERGAICVDLKTGQTKWQERAVGKGSICWADDMLYLFSENGGRAALATCSPNGLEIRGQIQVDGQDKSWAHPVVIGGRLYLRYERNLYCFDVKAE